MAGHEGDSTGPHSEGFEAIMARFFNPETEAGPEEGSLSAALAPLQERPGDPELHRELVARMRSIREAAPEALGEPGGALLAVLEELFEQMANFDVRLHRIMYRDLEGVFADLDRNLKGETPETALSEWEAHLRRHLFVEDNAGGEESGSSAEGGALAVADDLRALAADPADEGVLERLGGRLDELSEELDGAPETLALRMGDVLGDYAEGQLEWTSAMSDTLQEAASILTEAAEVPEGVLPRLEALRETDNGPEGGGAEAVPPAVERLIADPASEEALNDLGMLLDDVSEALEGDPETLALRMGDVLGAYSEGVLPWSEQVAERLRAAAGALVDGDAEAEIDALQALQPKPEEQVAPDSSPQPASQEAAPMNGLGSALEALAGNPGDRGLLEQARAAAEASAAEYAQEGGPFASLAQRLHTLFEGLAAFDIRLHKIFVEDLRAAIGALGEDEQAAEDAHERLARHLPSAPGGEEGGEVADEEPETSDALGEAAAEAPVPEEEPESQPQAEPDDGGEGPQVQSEPNEETVAETPQVEIPDGIERLPEDADPDLVSAFIEESREGLEELDQALMALEDHPEDEERLHSAFRTIHTIKGTAGFVGLVRLQGLAHAMESVMDRLRSFEVPLNAEMMDDLLAGTDILRKVVDRVVDGFGDNVEVEPVATHLAHYLRPDYTGSGSAPAASRDSSDSEPAAQEQSEAATASAPASGEDAPTGAGEDSEGGGSREAQTLRVPLDRLDRLFNLVGELVLTRNQNRELARRVANALDDERLAEDLAEEAHRLDLVTSDLQSAVMQTRMHSLSASFNKFKRVIRDLARKTHKEVQLDISGEQTELDRNVIEAIQDPLVHLIRNSVDHGVEEPEEREAAGKSRAGKINLRAYYEENFVVIEVGDDGAGLSAEKLRQKAVERGVIDQSEADQLSEREAQQLIFAPGFSSADQVSDISGRGVGMDVVRSNVESLKGSIDLDSTVGEGTTVRIRLPLTLSIQQTLIVQIGPEHFAIPLEAVKETLDFEPDRVTTVRGQRVYQREGEILPILQMTELFGMSRVHDGDARYLVVLELGVQRAGILVDRIVGKEEAVMKSLDALKGIHEPDYFAGASVRGDGRISLVVDVARLFSRVATMRGHSKTREVAEEEGREETFPYLLLDGGADEVYALAREDVHHIELVSVNEVQWMNGHEYLKRENRAVPVVRLATVTGESFRHPGDEAYIVFMDDGEGNWMQGILTNHLHGIQHLRPTEQGSGKSVAGISGAALWEDQVVGILDREAVERSAEQRVPDDLAAGA
ncbi:chemotaxis protein CheW [Thiohalorhabdus methylotrophus]|uniref:histidine kinase n=1 Tax=Thiohalorhabdus methylotrophus TaxID=3242694 RepID=A0ABV4TVU6_9GAMM